MTTSIRSILSSASVAVLLVATASASAEPYQQFQHRSCFDGDKCASERERQRAFQRADALIRQMPREQRAWELRQKHRTEIDAVERIDRVNRTLNRGGVAR